MAAQEGQVSRGVAENGGDVALMQPHGMRPSYNEIETHHWSHVSYIQRTQEQIRVRLALAGKSYPR